MKKIIIAVVLLCSLSLSACSVFGGSRIGRDEALAIALQDAGVERAAAFDVDVEYEHDRYNKWYEIDFDAGNREYDYRIQAESGEILSAKSK